MQSRNILQLEGISLFFKMHAHLGSSWKQRFINFMANPIQSILKADHYFPALDDINLTIGQGEKLGILGMNGSGKTTLCRLIAGVYKPDGGEIVVGGQVRAIFDVSNGILEELTGRENAYMLACLIFQDRPLEEIQYVVDEAMKFAELGEFVHMPIKTYSKGMKARLGLSIISSLPSDLLILDEAMDGADLYFQRKLKKRLSHIIDNSGAVILVNHDHESLRAHSNRIIVMSRGKLVFDGSPNEAIDYYLELCHKAS